MSLQNYIQSQVEKNFFKKKGGPAQKKQGHKGGPAQNLQALFTSNKLQALDFFFYLGYIGIMKGELWD